jgi:hypothetical protein
VLRHRDRVADELLVTTLAWTLEELALVRRDATELAPDVDLPVRRPLDVALGLLRHSLLASAPRISPTPADRAAVKASGPPWRTVAALAAELRRIEEAHLDELARRLVFPDDRLRARLFQLAVLGQILAAVEAAGAKVVSQRPLSGAAPRPAYDIRDALGRVWHLWFEAAGIWGHYRKRSPYVQASAGVLGENHPLGADLLLLLPGQRALVVECKYSANRQYVSRGGYHQAVTYATETITHLASSVTAVVVGPDGVVSAPGFAPTAAGTVGIVPPSGLPALVNSVLTSL